MMIKGFNGKITDVNEFNIEKYRTTISRFLNKSSWDESLLFQEIKVKRLEITCIYEQAIKGISIQNIFKKRGAV
ncbi:hypothetical protein [Cellulosilyticum ruminicola]|uniref:hypothetical protein n=1 Tax=Cellulosilyticum ruminicola TaxID=425254 RepID=UPI0012ECDB1E|nr:hypothetical protein [Cellulosilyticum ruminicola]